MAHLEICQVCKGSGEYRGEQCHGCNGKGQNPLPPSNPEIRWWGQPRRRVYPVPFSYIELHDF